MADLFDMQDEIVARLAEALNTQLVAAEARRAERAPKPDSMDLYFQGKACLNKGFTPQSVARARGFFERALALDPCNIEALIGTAMVDVRSATSLSTDDWAARFATAEVAVTKALSLAPENARAHFALGIVQIHTKRVAQGLAECELALALDRNLARAHGAIGVAKYLMGRGEETEAHVQDALRLSPRDRSAYGWMASAGLAKLGLGAMEEAVECLRRSVEINRNHPVTHFWLASALANLGRLDEARAEVRAGLAINPTFTIARLPAVGETDDPRRLAQRKRIVDGMRKAGVPAR